jgi:hypothetical protein
MSELDQQQKQREREPERAPWTPKQDGPFVGPQSPKVEKPDTEKLLKRMKSVEKDKARKYKQRSGQAIRQ